MLNLVEMGRANNGPLFPDARSQREFMERAHALSKRVGRGARCCARDWHWLVRTGGSRARPRETTAF